MRRLLLVFLLVLMSLQTVWSAAAAYCAHEQAPAAAHFGHHAHEHEGHASTDDANGASTHAGINLAAVDLDCHTCHGSGTVLFAPWEASAPLALSGHPLPQVAAQLPAPLNPRPERPTWRPAA